MRIGFAIFAVSLSLSGLAEEAREPQALIQQLGSPRYAEREQAQAKLLALGWRVKAPLKEALEKTADLEIRTRLEQILSQLGKPAWRTDLAAALREARALQKPLLVMGAVGDLDGFT